MAEKVEKSDAKKGPTMQDAMKMISQGIVKEGLKRYNKIDTKMLEDRSPGASKRSLRF